MAVALGRTLSVGEQEIESIQFAGILHDIGKIGVRDSVLLKPGRLTSEEFEAIKLHPIIGEQIVAPLGLIDAERAIIRHHHEKMDGSGYPDRLKGSEIPLLARIVAVADSFDAMTTTRSYRQARTLAQTLEEFERCRGTQFDPDVVDALLTVLDTETVQTTAATDAA
jgi:HD-GYP domain-containing protein (c-di-GMP phosphodiesterase class II)